MASIASGILATALTLWWSSVDQAKTSKDFERSTIANIKALENRVIGIESRVNSLISTSNGLGQKIKNGEYSLNASAQKLKAELSTYTDLLKVDLEVQAKSKYKELNAINVPERTLISKRTFHQGNQFYLLSKQLLVHVKNISLESRLASFKIIYPDNTEVLLDNIPQGGRAIFDFQKNKYMLDVGNINYFNAQNRQMKTVEITISRASM
ncbi:MAG: hypothetical protein MJK12_09240 [Colwellia sp.]|nr:hypothetical protein [Colwellia sp.]